MIARNERRMRARQGAARRRGRDRAAARRFHRIGRTDGRRRRGEPLRGRGAADAARDLLQPADRGLVVVDDSTSLDQEVFNMEAYEGADWVRISDEVPVDEDSRDRVLEASRPATTPARPARSPRPRWSRATTSSTRTRTARTLAARTPSSAGCRGERRPTSPCPTRMARRSASPSLPRRDDRALLLSAALAR